MIPSLSFGVSPQLPRESLVAYWESVRACQAARRVWCGNSYVLPFTSLNRPLPFHKGVWKLLSISLKACGSAQAYVAFMLHRAFRTALKPLEMLGQEVQHDAT